MFYVIARDDDHRPTKGHDLDAGLDLKARASGVETGKGVGLATSASKGDNPFIIIRPGATAKIPVGVHVVAAPGYAGRLTTRSGHASRGIHVVGGLIDPGYTGEVAALVYNGTEAPVTIADRERVAQLTVERVEQGRIMVADGANLKALIAGAARDVGTVVTGTRGGDGFGSTGTTEPAETVVAFGGDVRVSPAGERALSKDDERLVDRVVDVLTPIADRINAAEGAKAIQADDLYDAAARLYAEGLLIDGPVNATNGLKAVEEGDR